MTISYWRSIDDLHTFAHGPAHRAGWAWWDRTVKQLGHISICHEIYQVDRGQWESIFINAQPALLGATRYLKRTKKAEGQGDDYDSEDQWISPLVDASKGVLRTSAGRLGSRGSQGTEHDKYGPNPYDGVSLSG